MKNYELGITNYLNPIGKNAGLDENCMSPRDRICLDYAENRKYFDMEVDLYDPKEDEKWRVEEWEENKVSITGAANKKTYYQAYQMARIMLTQYGLKPDHDGLYPDRTEPIIEIYKRMKPVIIKEEEL